MRTLGSPILALLLQAQSGAVSGDANSSILSLVVRSGPVSKAVLLTLALMSVGCWSIMLFKLWVFRRAERQSNSFLDVFRRSSKFSEVQAVCRSLTASPLVGLFQSGYAGNSGAVTLLPYSGLPGFSYPFFLGLFSILFFQKIAFRSEHIRFRTFLSFGSRALRHARAVRRASQAAHRTNDEARVRTPR